MQPEEIEIVKMVIRGIIWVTVLLALCGAGKYGIRRYFDEKAAERRSKNKESKE